MFIISVIILLACTGFFIVLLDYLIKVGWKILEGKNAFLVILMISAEVVFLLVSFGIVWLILKRYFL